GINGRPVPIIGIGGISNVEDALEFVMAGASAVQLGTINFVNPRAGLEVIEGLQRFLRHHHLPNLQPIIGAALPAAKRTQQPV
ncbi:MAG TPA: hypothetical protein VFU69_17055, partial [Ktedonobacterales bacterium]|nr:hypothetical protein [Ktedonobacterales bacterium]